MKVSYFNYHYDVEGSAIGAATQIRAIAAALARLGHRVDVQFRTAQKPGEQRDYLGLKKNPGAAPLWACPPPDLPEFCPFPGGTAAVGSVPP